MLKKLSVVICGMGLVLMASGAANAQSAAQDAKEKTKSAAQKTSEYLSDSEITAAVKSKFAADSKVSALDIHVETTDGVVTLTGKASSAPERAEAVKVAKGTGGVKRVIDKVTIEKNAHAAGTSGVVDKTEDAAKKAGDKTEDAAKKVGQETKDAAVKTKDVVADATVTSEVKTKLLADPKVGGLKIDVDTKDNVVTLTGTVSSVEEKNEALRLARTSAGVKRVVDKLTVK